MAPFKRLHLPECILTEIARQPSQQPFTAACLRPDSLVLRVPAAWRPPGMCEGSAAAVGEALSTARTGAVSLAQCGARGEARRSHPHSPSQLTESRIFGERATVSTDRQAAASHPYVPMFVACIACCVVGGASRHAG